MRKKQNFSHLCSKDKVFLPSNQTVFESIPTHSWFNQTATKNHSIKTKSSFTPESNSYYSKKYIFYPTQYQKDILEHWFQGNTYLYNQALRYIKQQKYFFMGLKELKQSLTLNKIRDALKQVKKDVSKYISNKLLQVPNLDPKLKKKLSKIQQDDQDLSSKNPSSIPTHILDRSIGKAIEMYKSALSNFRAKNIKKFRIRYHRYGPKSNQSLYIEPTYVMKNGNITDLGELELIDPYNGLNYKIEKKNIINEFQIRYISNHNKYEVILVHQRENCNDNKEKEDFISLDPGINPILTGVSGNNGVFIGKDGSSIFKKLLDKIDKYANARLKENKKKKAIERVRNKIKNMATDFHWKTIVYLTNNYHKILFGDMSVKGIVELNGRKMSKRVLHCYELFLLKERLKNRCKERGVIYEEVNEYHTSKTCSVCGNLKKDLGLNKQYDCLKCGIHIQRDLNGARCIYFASCL
jgi:IS605 OrfB family transposase